MTDSSGEQEAKNITAVDTEYEGIVVGIQNYETQSFDGYTCGYDYISTEMQEVQYLRADPFGIKMHWYNHTISHYNGKKEHVMKENGWNYHFRWETKEEDMQSGVRVLDGLNPTKRALNEDKLAKFMTTNKDVWSKDQSPDYLVIDNFVDFAS